MFVSAQQVNELERREKTENISSIPPLDSVINMALQTSPLLKEQNTLIEIERYRLRSAKSLWMDAINVRGEAKYGSVDDVIIKEYNTGEVDGHYGYSFNTRYSAGVYINLSLFDVMDRKRTLLISKNEIKLAEFRRDEIVKKLRELIIMQYNQVVLSRNLLDIKSKAKEFSSIQVNMAEVEFKNGKINIYEFSRVIEADTKAQTEFESIKAQYNIAYSLLFEIIGNQNKE